MDYAAFLAVGVISKFPSTVGLLSLPWASSPSIQARIGFLLCFLPPFLNHYWHNLNLFFVVDLAEMDFRYIVIYPHGCDVYNHLSLFVCVANHHKLLPGLCCLCLLVIILLRSEFNMVGIIFSPFKFYQAGVILHSLQ